MTTTKPTKKTRSKSTQLTSAMLTKTPASDYLATLGTSGTDGSEDAAVALLISTHQDIREHYMKLLSERLDINKKISTLEDDVAYLTTSYESVVDDFYEVDEKLLYIEESEAQLPSWYKWLKSKVEPFLLKYFKANSDYEPYFD